MVERQTVVLMVIGSTPIARINSLSWCNGRTSAYEAEDGGSIPSEGRLHWRYGVMVAPVPWTHLARVRFPVPPGSPTGLSLA